MNEEWSIMYAGREDGMTQAECIEEERPVVAIPPVINYAEFANEGTKEERAAARLIVAAPELLEACKYLCAEIRNGCNDKDEAFMEGVALAEAATARAEGCQRAR